MASTSLQSGYTIVVGLVICIGIPNLMMCAEIKSWQEQMKSITNKNRIAMNKIKKHWFVAEEDTDLYNVFNIADFDEDGYYGEHNGEDGYHIDDFDVVFESNRFDDCERWIDSQMNLN